MSRPIYNDVLYKKLLDEKVVEISRTFFGEEYWENKKNHGVLVAYDFIPSNGELKLLETNTNVGIFKEYIPYFDFQTLGTFCRRNRYTKIIAVVNSYWYDQRGWGAKTTPSKDFMSLLESMLSGFGVNLELISAPEYPRPIPKIDIDENTFVLRFSFDPESKIDEMAADKNLFIDHIKKVGLSNLLPTSGDNLFEEKYENGLFPDLVFKDPELDNRRGIQFWKNFRGLEARKEKLKRPFQYVEKFVISDKLEGLDQYNLELRGLCLVTNEDVVSLNISPFVDSKRYTLNKDGSLQQIRGHGTSFIEDTMIQLADGKEKKIQDVVPGDKVEAYDIKNIDENKAWRNWIDMNWTGMDDVKTVGADVFGKVYKKTVGYILFNEKYRVTKHAAVCIADKDWKWKFESASDVKVGDKVLLSGNETIEIFSIEVSDDIVNSYGLEIDNYDNYFGDRMMAHNISKGSWCFIAGTKVRMSDGSEKNIEDVKLKDTVMSWDEVDNEIKSSIVVGLKQPNHDDMILIKYDNGSENTNTFDHPYYVKNKGWCSYKPQLTGERYGMDVKLLEVGDVCYHDNDGKLDEVKVISIEESLEEVQTYIIVLENFNTFFANGILTHNKDGTTEYGYHISGRTSCFLPEQLINMADGTLKKIEDVEIGDMVEVWDELSDTVKESPVDEIRIKLHDDVYELHLKNGKVLKPTGNHPFWTSDKGWTTIDGHDPNHAGGKGHLEVGDSVYDISDSWIEVEKIVKVDGEHQTYNFINMETGTIIADGIVTHNSTRINSIGYFNVQSLTSAAGDAGDDIATRQYACGGISNQYMWAMGGYPGPKNWISYMSMESTSGGTSDRGDLNTGGQIGAGGGERPDTSNSYQGSPRIYYSGGQNGTRRNHIQDFDATTTSGNATDTGDLNESLSAGCGMGGSQYSFHAGGRKNNNYGSNIIQRWDATVSSGVTYTDHGDLINSPYGPGAANDGGYKNAEIGQIAGGYIWNGSSAPACNNIQYISFSSFGANAVDKGDLARSKGWGGTISGDEYFFYVNGHDGSSVDALEYWPLSTVSSNTSSRTSGASHTEHGAATGAGFSGN